MPDPTRCLAVMSLALLAGPALSGCAAYETARVVVLDDVPAAEAIRRTSAHDAEPLFVDTTGALVAKRQLKTAISAEPDLEAFVRRELEHELGREIERLRVDYIGYRYAYYFPSRHDDFVLRVELQAPQAGLDGEFEAVIRGIDLRNPTWLLGDWPADIPGTESPPEADDQARRIERMADQRAWLHRAVIREVTRRLAVLVAAG
jgi:hypothetical protein